MSNIITRAEREARKGQPAKGPVAQFRVKGGCKTCKPIPAYAKPANLVEPSLTQDKHNL